jgi:alkaline phosphatase D
MKPAPVSRRAFVVRSSAALAATAFAPRLRAADSRSGPYQAMGTRAGEATDTTAIVWTRLTQQPTRNNAGVVLAGRARDRKKGDPPPAPLTVPVEQLEGACPGMAGRVRLRYGAREDLLGATTTDWADVSEAGDFIHQFRLNGLKPGAMYHYASEAAAAGSSRMTSTVRGRFATAPAPDAPGDFRFCVMTCQGYPDRGHPDGHDIYPAMQALDTRFTCLTGDLVYYDSNEPRAVTPRLARYHWERMFSLPRLVEFTRHVGTYWLKDDHDTVTNDSWPGMKAGELTFAEGLKIFRQQAPLHDGPSYRTVRWGRDLQVWFTEGRDFRSPNTMKDGPDKTIWGAEQKAWFKRTVKESNATWKVLVSPTPLVGPDRATGKNDNHSNAGFTHEGDEIRGWLKANVPNNFFVMCGDRHWQYHSVHPDTGLNEFSAGAASDEHAGGTPGENPRYHKFHRVKGGFLSVTLRRDGGKSTILFEHRDVQGKVVYTWSKASS